MSIQELFMIILVTCGSGTSDKIVDCQESILNCAVQYNGVIQEKNVLKCVAKEKDKHE